jgi:putative membrane protein
MMGGGLMNGYGWFGSFGLLGGILNLVITLGVIVGVVLLVVWLVRRLGASGPITWSQPQPDAPISPREILQTRYARGEITREQYQQMLTDVS